MSFDAGNAASFAAGTCAALLCAACTVYMPGPVETGSPPEPHRHEPVTPPAKAEALAISSCFA